MKYSSVISEIAHDGKICMEPGAYHNLKSLMFSNIELGAKVVVEEKEHAEKVVIGEVATESHEQMVQQIIFPSDAYSANARAQFYGMLGEEDEVVNVVTIAGPMTRGGGACSYGSLDHRNLIMEAANVPQVKAHIVIARTPGGMASTLRDYRMALNYAHARGQKIWMLCDGDVASGGAFAGTIFDGIYAVNPDDQIGSLGMYCAFFTNKDGDKDAITQETYHEYYAARSKDKNAWYRAAADDDMSLIAESVEADLEQLLANVKADRPKVKKDQLTGKMYRMGDVKGSLIDGFTTLNQLALMALKEWNKRGGAVLPAKMGGTVKGGVITEQEPKVQTINNQEQMKNYPNLGKVAGLEDALELQADGYVSLSEEQADVMESAIEKASEVNEATKQALTNAQAQVEALTAEKEQLAQQLAEATSNAEDLQSKLSASKEELVNAQTTAEAASEEAKAAHEKAMQSLQTEQANALAEKQAEVDELHKQLEDANASIASKESTIADLNATIAELNKSAGEKPNGGGAPRGNGNQEGAPRYSMEGRYDHSLSPAENRKRIEEYNKKLAKMAAENN